VAKTQQETSCIAAGGRGGKGLLTPTVVRYKSKEKKGGEDDSGCLGGRLVKLLGGKRDLGEGAPGNCRRKGS